MGQKREIYRDFGSSPKALWTVFEVTLGGEGSGRFRPLIDYISWTYSIFIAAYIAFAVFAVICIIQALFLKDTLEIAANDAEAMVQEHMLIKAEYMKKLHSVFLAADTSGDGKVTLEEFEIVMAVPDVQNYMEVLELQCSEAVALFNLLDNGGGVISYEEFVSGLMKLKGQARSMDVISIQSDCRKVFEKCQDLENYLFRVHGKIHPPGLVRVSSRGSREIVERAGSRCLEADAWLAKA